MNHIKKIGTISQVLLTNQLEDSVKEYGEKVIQDRAIPDYRDGLKPVQRRILWSMLTMGMRPDGGYIKSARVVGDVMGRFHPHGDNAIYQAMVKMKLKSPSLLNGKGNWSNFKNDPAAAMRYTEAKMGEWAFKNLLDPIYMEVIPYVSNYDNSETEPVYLPAKTPNMLLFEIDGIGVGSAVSVPTFTEESVRVILLKALEQKITPEFMVKNLVVNCPAGGKYVSGLNPIRDYVESGQASFEYECTYKFDSRTLTFIVNGFPPGFNFDSSLEKIRKIEGVYSAAETSDKVGIEMTIILKKTYEEETEKTIEAVQKILKSKNGYFLNQTERFIKDPNEPNPEVGASFKSNSAYNYLMEWVEYRVALEKAMLKNEMGKLKKSINYLKLILKAIDYRSKILEILDKHPGQENERVAALLEVSIDDAKAILSIAIRKFGRLSVSDTKKQINKLIEDYKKFKGRLSQPYQSVAMTL